MLCKFLKKKRLNAILTQQEAGTLLGYENGQFLSNVERGLSRPPLHILFKMCDVYSVSKEEMRQIYIDDHTARAGEKANRLWNQLAET